MRFIKYVLGMMVSIGFILSVSLFDEPQVTKSDNYISTDNTPTPTATPDPGSYGTGGGNHVGGGIDNRGK